MKLQDHVKAKVDQELRAALSGVEGDAILRALLVVAPPVHSAGGAVHVDPARFSSVDAYRAALAKGREAAIGTVVAETVDELERIGLHTKWSSRSRTVIVEGPAEALMTALEDPRIESGSLDSAVVLAQGS